MTNKKPLKEQVAFEHYEKRSFSAMAAPAMPPTRPRQRVVTTPHEIVRPAGWTAMAERREKQRRVTPRAIAEPVARASSGRIAAVRPRPTPPPAIPPRSRRLQGREKRSLWKTLGLLAVLVIAVLATGFALTGPAFRVQQVSVGGTQNRALINQIQHLGVQGQTIFLVNTGALSLLIGALPLVNSVDVAKNWPDELTVTVRERVPLLLWQTSRGTFSVDRTGMVMASAADTSGADTLQTVVDARTVAKGARSLRPGDHLSAALIPFGARIFVQAPKLAGLSGFTLRLESSSYPVSGRQVAGPDTFVIVSPAGWRAYLGGPELSNPLENRLLELKAILDLAQRRQLNLATIDLRFGQNAYYTLKS